VRFVGVSLDCGNPSELATFYMKLLKGRLLWDDADSVGVQVPGLVMVMQRVQDYQRPQWPGESIVHLDLTAGDHLDEPEAQAVALGAQLVDPQPDRRWRVLLDPAGHPFCITTVTPPPELLQSPVPIVNPAVNSARSRIVNRNGSPTFQGPDDRDRLITC